MTSSINILLGILVGNGLVCLSLGRFRLTALSDSAYSVQLYQKLRNESPPSGMDPTIWDAKSRKRVCEDILGSGFFHFEGLLPVDVEEIYAHRYHPKYASIFKQIYSFTGSRRSYEYVNRYRQRKFNVSSPIAFYHFKEYTFVCPAKDSLQYDEPILSYYVSKEYNVGPFGRPYMPGRFVIGTPWPEYSYDMILAEAPAYAYVKENFNIELHYLQIRKYVQPAKSNDADPLCQLTSKEYADPENQYYRFCVAITRSSYFKDKVDYPEEINGSCSLYEVSFKTTEAVEEMAGKSYYERMISCPSTLDHLPTNEEILPYISRAYLSNAIFVYLRDPSNGKIYLENFSTNISIVDELNSFDFVEY